MQARFRSWWQQLRQRRVAIAVTSAIIVVVIALIIFGYWFDVAGFNGYTQVSTIRTLSGPTAGTITRTEAYQSGKTLWDWMQLLIVPVALAIVAILFNRATTRSEQKIAQLRYQDEQNITEQRYQNDLKITLDKQREDLLQAYLDNMSELLLKEGLRQSDSKAEVREIAWARTLTILPRLDGERKGSVLRFLHEANLIGDGMSIIDLHHADLKGAHLEFADLHDADLSGADLSAANLNLANLSGANLEDTDTRDASFLLADLKGIYRPPDD